MAYDYDRLTIEVWTNGTLKPNEAISLAAKIMSEHLSLFIDLSDNAKNVEIMVEKEESKKKKSTRNDDRGAGFVRFVPTTA